MKIDTVAMDLFNRTMTLQFDGGTDLVVAFNIINTAIKSVPHPALDAVIIDVLRAEGIIPAIKYHREQTGSGLKVAKDYVCSLRDSLGILPPPNRF